MIKSKFIKWLMFFSCFLIFTGCANFIYTDSPERYSSGFFDRNIINDVPLPNDPSTSGRKIMFSYADTGYCLYENRYYSDIYYLSNNEKAGELYEKPRTAFLLGNYLYYGYGEERQIRAFDFPHFEFFNVTRKNFKYAKFNLDTMQNETITKQEYEETYDYQSFRNWNPIVEPITNLRILVWIDHDPSQDYYGRNVGYIRNGSIKQYNDNNYNVCFTIRNADFPIHTEYHIYHSSKSTDAVYVPASLIANDIDELNEMLKKFPDAVNITISWLDETHFTEQDIGKIADKFIFPNHNAVKIIEFFDMDTEGTLRYNR